MPPLLPYAIINEEGAPVMKRIKRDFQKGAILVFVLIVCTILLMLIFSMLLTSQYGLRAKIRGEALSLAETGIEYARGCLQDDPDTTKKSTQDLTGISVPLTYLNGRPVKFPPYSNYADSICFTDVADQPAYGVQVTDNNGVVRGYFAYIMSGTDPVHCYSLGCVGPGSNQMEERKRVLVHVQFKPYTYSEFTKFLANPYQPLNISAAYRDPFYNQEVYKTGGGTQISPGTWLDPGATLQSFNKTFTAGDVKFYPSKDKPPTDPYKGEFIGFNMGSYFSPRDDTTAPPRPTRYTVNSLETQQVYLNDKSGLYGLRQDEMGLPTSSGKDTSGDGRADEPAQIERIMDALKTISTTAGNKGIYIEGNRTIVGDRTESYNGEQRISASYPGSTLRAYYGTADDQMYDYPDETVNPYRNKFLTAKEDPTRVGGTATEYLDCFDVAANAPKHYGDGYDDPHDTKTYWEKPGSSTGSTDWISGKRTIDPTDDYQNREYVVRFYVSGGVGKVEITNVQRDYRNASGTTTNTWKIMKDGTDQPYVGSNLPPIDISDSAGNPAIKLIYLRGNVRVYGKVMGKITVASEGKITIGRSGTTGDADLVYYGDHDGDGTADEPSDYAYLRNGNKSKDSANKSLLGLVTPRKVVVDPSIDRSQGALSTDGVSKMSICASIFEGGSPPPNDSSPQTTPNDSLVSNKFTICANQKKADPNINSENSSSYWGNRRDWSNISFVGSSICFHRNKNYSKNYAAVAEKYDERLLISQSPYFPTMSKGWNIVGWAEVNLDSGKDIRYNRF